jgi:hypothetical protein
VRLDTAHRTLDGTVTLLWRNISSDPVRELHFHLYLNAFRNDQSTFRLEAENVLPHVLFDQDTRGSIDFTGFRIGEGPDLLHRLEFIRPDDGNPHDSTLCAIHLEEPIRPGTEASVRFTFTASLPALRVRTGHAGDFFMAGQWFPKIAVHEGMRRDGTIRRGWSGHQFHALGEFYANFGVYDVSITLPDGFVVGATGVERSRRSNADGTQTVLYRAEDVHDFGWAASPHLLEIRERWRHVELRLLLPPHRRHLAQRHLDAAIATLAYMDKHIGRYPYPGLTIVDPPHGAEGAGGMEYPTLVTGESFAWMPGAIRLPESVTVHEVIHQYWQGMVANNETEEAWLDEGLTTYYEDRVMDETYGSGCSVVDLPGFRVGSRAWSRTRYTGMRNPSVAPINTRPWEFRKGGYWAITYSKTAAVLVTLERLAGRDVFDAAMQAYFERWRFRHPRGHDFRSVLLGVIPRFRPDLSQDFLRSFFEQLLDGTGVCDYAVTVLDVRRSSTGDAENRRGAESGSVYISRAVLRRLGDVRLPVDVLVRFSDGSEERSGWDGQSDMKEILFIRQHPVRDVVIDPEGKLCVDINVVNNSRTVTPPALPLWDAAMRLLVFLQAVVG